MKKQNYRLQDISTAMESRKAVLHQLEQIEMNLWTDNVDEAIKRTADMHLSLVKLSQMQSVKRVEDKFNQLYQVLNANGINAQIVYRHKKAD